MQGEASETEPDGQERAGQIADAYYNFVIAFVWTLVLGWVILRLLSEDEVRMHILNRTVKVLHKLTSTLGVMALMAEKEYNDIVSTMH